MQARNYVLAIALVVATLSVTAFPAILNVPADYPTIQAAIDANGLDDEIVLAPRAYVVGTYWDPGIVMIRPTDPGLWPQGTLRKVTIRSVDPNDPAVVAATIIRYPVGGRAFQIEDSDVRLAGLTITGKSPASGPDGAGVMAVNSKVAIERCLITESKPRSNSIIRGESSDITLEKCTITGNELANAICSGNLSDITISKCTVTRNKVTTAIGLISCVDSDLRILDSDISFNTGGYAYLISSWWQHPSFPMVYPSSLAVRNCTISENGRDNLGKSVVYSESPAQMSGCDITDNMCIDTMLTFYSTTSVSSCTIARNYLPRNRLLSSANSSGIRSVRGCSIYDNTFDRFGLQLTASFNTVVGNITTNDTRSEFLALPGSPIDYSIVWDNSPNPGGWVLTSPGPIWTAAEIWGPYPYSYAAVSNHNPRFIFDSDYHLRPCSPWIDWKYYERISTVAGTDLDGRARPIEGNGDGVASNDCGVYEYDSSRPALAVSRSYLAVTYPAGIGRPMVRPLRIANAGSGVLSWSISSDAPWLSVSQSSGFCTTNANALSIVISAASLTAGEYIGNLTVTSGDADNSPRKVKVRLTVVPSRRVPAEYGTIQEAVNAASPGDYVALRQGTYTGGGVEIVVSKAITIQSFDPEDPEVVATTILDASGPPYTPHRCLVINGNNTVRVAGLTIRNGRAEAGAGVQIAGGSSAQTTLYKCIIENCVASAGLGGGILASDTMLTVDSCLIRGNSCSVSGGGVYAGYLDIRDSVISGNSAGQNGGGISLDEGNIANCIVSANTSTDNYPAISSNGTRPVTISNCTIADNVSPSTYNLINNNGTRLWRSIVWGNTPKTLVIGTWLWNSCIEGVNRSYTINADPLFVGAGDYRLSAASPCVDAYFPTSSYPPSSFVTPPRRDIEGYARPIDGNADGVDALDLGAYEYHPQVIANAGGNQTVYANYTGKAVVSLDGSGSDNCMVGVVSYLWSWGVGTRAFSATEVQPVIELPAGVYPVELAVSDDKGDSASDTCQVTVIQNQAPTANAGPDQMLYVDHTGKVNVTLDGSASSDPEGQTLTYQWTGDINGTAFASTEVSPSVELPEGVYTFSLVVNDGVDVSAADTCTVTVVGPKNADILFIPRLLNVQSHENRVMAIMTIRGATRADLDPAAPVTMWPFGTTATHKSILGGFSRGPKVVVIVAMFDAQPILDSCQRTTWVWPTIETKLKSGQYVTGRDFVLVWYPPRRGHH